MSGSRKNWTTFQQMSYETNKRLRKQALQAEKQCALENLKQQRLLDERRECRRQKLEYLRQRFHGRSDICSEPPLSDGANKFHSTEQLQKISFAEDVDASSKTKNVLRVENLTKYSSKSNCNLEEALSLLDGELKDTTLNNCPSTVCPTIKKPLGCQVSRIPHLKAKSTTFFSRGLALRRSKSASELHPSTSDSSHSTKADQEQSTIVPISKADSTDKQLTDSTSQSEKTSGIESFSSFGEDDRTNKAEKQNPPESKSDRSSNWFRTGSPPLTDSDVLHHENTPCKPPASVSENLTLVISTHPCNKKYHTTATTPLVCAAPIYSTANKNAEQNCSVTTVIDRVNLPAFAEKINTITLIRSPTEPKISPHFKIVTPRAQTPEEMYPVKPIPGYFLPHVSYISPTESENNITTINSNYFHPSKPLSISVRSPYLTLGEPQTYVTSTNWTNSINHANSHSQNENCTFEQHNEITSPHEVFMRPRSMEMITREEGDGVVQNSNNCANTPLRSILKPRALNAHNSPERLPGFCENFSELTALRARDSIELAPTRLRMRTAPECFPVQRDTSPDTLDGSETERSGSPRSLRKTVRFADQMGDRLMKKSNSISDSIANDYVPFGTGRPLVRSLSMSPTTVKREGPVISVIYPKQSQDGVIYPSTGFEAPIRNTILPSLGPNNPFCSIPSPTASPPKLTDTPHTINENLTRETEPRPNGPLGKPPIKPQQKLSAPGRLNRGVKLGYADLFSGRRSRPMEQNQYANIKHTYPSATVGLSPSPVCSDVTESIHDSSRNSPYMIADRVSPIHLKIPSLRSASGPPTMKRDLREHAPARRIVNTVKLDQFTRAASEPRRITPTINQQEVHIPSAFNAFRLTCSPEATEKENLTAMTRLTELNYETALTTTNPSLTIPSAQPIPKLPDYEGMDAELSERLRSQQRKQAFQHAIYLSGQASNNQINLRHGGSSQLASRSATPQSNFSRDGSDSTTNTNLRFTSSTVTRTPPDMDHVVYVNQPVQAIESKSLPSSGRLLSLRPQASNITSHRSDHARERPLGTTITNAYTLERHGLVHPVSNNRFQLCPTISGRRDLRSLPGNRPHNVLTYTPKSSTLPRNPIHLGEFDSEVQQKKKQNQFLTNLKNPIKEPRGATPRTMTLSPSLTQTVPGYSVSVEKLSDSLAEFIESENACNQNATYPFNSTKPIYCTRTPIHVDRSNLRVRKSATGPSTISIEEARLLKSLERLNNRLCGSAVSR